MPKKVGSILLFILFLTAASQASGVLDDVTMPVGHPRSRFPLSVYTERFNQADLDSSIDRAVTDWNTVFHDTYGVDAFRATSVENTANVVVHVDTTMTGKLMGVTEMTFDHQTGVINLPVTVSVGPPQAKGQTSRETLLFEVTAHELGHVLGLPHDDRPGSLMCCTVGSIDFHDEAVRNEYIEARRHPSVASVLPDLKAHYPLFWDTHP